jgi:hypothetical protein
MGDTEGHQSGSRDPREHLNDEVLNAYLDRTDNGLSPTARGFADAHLADCAACRAALNDLTTTLAILRAVPETPLRRSFILTPEAAAAAGGPRLPRQFPRWVWPTRWATAVAAVIFAVTIGLDLGASTPAAPAANAPAPTATSIGVTPTTCVTQECLASFGDPNSVIVFPTPTAVVMTPVTPQGDPFTGAELRPIQITSGLLALLGAGLGFLFPAYRKRQSTTA